MKITAHTLVKNEARFVWYSVMSVINHVDEILIWDSGSSDGTIEIIDEIKRNPFSKNKVKFKQDNITNKNTFDKVREKMLDATKTDWFLMIDADEIWWESSIRKVTKFIRKKGEKYESLVIPTINLVGDMYHFQEKQAGKYKLAGRVGHFNLRGINTQIPGLKSLGQHGVWGWADEDNKMIQDRDKRKIKFLSTPYLHATYLQRASTRSADGQVLKRIKKLKYEFGEKFPRDYFYPEVFFRPKPDIVPDVWQPMDMNFKYRAFIETPLRKFKRRHLPDQVGY